MAGGLLNRLRQGLGLAGGAGARAPGGAPARRIEDHFRDLAKAGRGLPGAAARYVALGDNPSVLSTLQGRAARDCWRMRMRTYPPRDAADVFANPAEWRIDEMRRMGEVLAAVEPITYDWGYFGTRKSPDWLRHVVTLWLGHDRKAQPIGTLLALADETEQRLAAALDIVFCRDTASYGSSNSVDRFAGVGDWLAGAHDGVVAALPGLAADVRAELSVAVGRFGLHRAYLDLLLESATGTSKKARTTARQALTGADGAALVAALRAQFPGAAPGRRAELVEVAAAALGDMAAALLSEWREGEGSAKVLAALDQVSAALRPAPAPAAGTPAPWRIDGPRGYAAVDGSWVELPAPEPLPDPGPVPPRLLRVLDPAVAEFNRMLAAGKAEANAQARDERRWHWSRQFSPRGEGDIAKLAWLAEGTQPVDAQRAQPMLDWLRFHQFKHPAVGEFLRDPRLTLHHLARLAVATTNGFLHGVTGDWSGPIGAAVLHRLANGADVRNFLALWEKAGGKDHISEHLTRFWHSPLPDLEVPIWPVLCARFAQLDEALGLVPQTGAEPMRPIHALELLAMFPRLPERYRARLMLLAGDSSARLREAARALLQQTPGIGGAIALQLQDGRQETRALAADWLAARGEREQAPAIRKALAKERSDLARAAMITALERLGEDVSEYFDHEALVKEARAGLARPRPKGLEWLRLDRLPALAWRDGTPVDPVLSEWWVVLAAKLKQPGGKRADEPVARSAGARGCPFGSAGRSWPAGPTRTRARRPTRKPMPMPRGHVDATLRQNIDMAKRYPQSAAYWPTDRATVFAQLKQMKAGTYLGSAADSKGVLALATRVNGADAAQRVRAFLKDHGQRVSQAKALLELLAAVGSGAALQLVLAAANRSKQRSVQAHAAALVEEIAERNGWSAAQLADRTIPTGGFDADGAQEIECGDNRSYRLRLDAQDAVMILNAEGREVKALPGPRIDAERPAVEAAKKQLATARKEVKQVLAAQAERLQEAMCLQRSWERGEWESFVAGHPIVGRLAARLVWQGVDGPTFRPLATAATPTPPTATCRLRTLRRSGWRIPRCSIARPSPPGAGTCPTMRWRRRSTSSDATCRRWARGRTRHARSPTARAG